MNEPKKAICKSCVINLLSTARWTVPGAKSEALEMIVDHHKEELWKFWYKFTFLHSSVVLLFYLFIQFMSEVTWALMVNWKQANHYLSLRIKNIVRIFLIANLLQIPPSCTFILIPRFISEFHLWFIPGFTQDPHKFHPFQFHTHEHRFLQVS